MMAVSMVMPDTGLRAVVAMALAATEVKKNEKSSVSSRPMPHPETYGGLIGLSTEPFSATEATATAKAAAPVSLESYRWLAQAGESFIRLNSEIAMAKGYFRQNPPPSWPKDPAAMNEVRVGMHSRIDEAATCLSRAREDLMKFLPPEAQVTNGASVGRDTGA